MLTHHGLYTGPVTKHPYQDYGTDTTELAYHLHYEHGMPIADAWSHVYDGTAVRVHRGAHA